MTPFPPADEKRLAWFSASTADAVIEVAAVSVVSSIHSLRQEMYRNETDSWTYRLTLVAKATSTKFFEPSRLIRSIILQAAEREALEKGRNASGKVHHNVVSDDTFLEHLDIEEADLFGDCTERANKIRLGSTSNHSGQLMAVGEESRNGTAADHSARSCECYEVVQGAFDSLYEERNTKDRGLQKSL